MPLAPVLFPSLTFLLLPAPGKQSAQEFAIDLAAAMTRVNTLVTVDDFMAPVQDGLIELAKLTYADDWGDPRVSTVRNVPFTTASVYSALRDLRQHTAFSLGPSYLPAAAIRRYEEARSMHDYPVVFRDATSEWIGGFLLKKIPHFIVYIGGMEEPIAGSDLNRMTYVNDWSDRNAAIADVIQILSADGASS